MRSNTLRLFFFALALCVSRRSHRHDSGDLLFDAKRVELSPGSGDFRWEGPTTGNMVLAPGTGQGVTVEGALLTTTSLQSPLVLANEVRSTAASNPLTLNGQSGEVIFSGDQLTLPSLPLSLSLLLPQLLFCQWLPPLSHLLSVSVRQCPPSEQFG